jgi:hypothetical protein
VLHDAAESVTGDTPAPAKSGDLRAALERTERTYNETHYIPTPRNDRERAMLHLVDKLDAYLWARSVDPAIVSAPEWCKQIDGVRDLAYDLGVENEVEEVLNE